MKKILNLLLLLTVFSSCHLNGSNDKYTIEGSLKNHPAKSVFLEKLGMQQITLVDSAKVDDKGAFNLQGISEQGFYRIKLDDQTFWLFLLQPVKYKVDIDLTAPEPFKITGSPDNDEFETALKRLNDGKREMEALKSTYMMYQQNHASPDTLLMITNEFNALSQKYIVSMKDAAKTAKSPLVAMFYVTNIPLQDYPNENKAVLDRMEKELPASSYTKDFRKMYDQYTEQAKAAQTREQAADPVAVGKPAPEIDLKNPDGKNIKLSSLKGKVVLIDFWASWCGPCRMEMPNVVAAYKRYKDKGFTVYSVSLDKDATAWKNSINALGMVWENHVSDLKWWQCEAALKYGVNGIPAAFLLDKNGIIVATNLRGEELDKKVAELVQ